ncbi:ABC transporter permease [Pseudaestuariivita atlantica]|uniref:Transport permease protein n=1 Tax=Pseudaestuariivita atlantica TaxID=1317121 RepID=A0A0L1JKK0_9RHOB|nr:ABC transporter permease [Pseudaestuariivita atlantica]KNG92247.1 sugar ABC transporter permease [Pseudaestuariivita atlantica]
MHAPSPPALPPASSLRARRFRTWRSILALVLREMSTTYGRSPGGYAWAILEPVAAIFLLSAAFQFVFRTPSLGSNFPFFFATGYLPYMLTLTLMNNCGRAIRFSRALLAYPGVTWSDAVFARAILTTLTDLLTTLIVITGIVLIFRIDLILSPGPIVLALAMAITVGIGVGSLNCYLFTAFPAWERVWSVITRPLLLVSGVIFLYDTLPDRAQPVMLWNPLTHVVGAARKGFFATYDADYLMPVYVFSFGLICWAWGFMLLHRHHKALINN